MIAFIVKILSTLFRSYSERIQDSMGDVTHSIKETLQNHRIIKIFNGQENEGDKFSEINEINRYHHMKLLRTKAIGDALTIFVASLEMLQRWSMHRQLLWFLITSYGDTYLFH